MFGLSRHGTAAALLLGLLAGPMFAVLLARFGPTGSALLLGGAVVAALVLYSPQFGLFLTVAVVPMERLGRLTSDESMHTISLMRILGLLVLASFLLHALVRKHKIRFGPASLLYGIYFGFAFLSLAQTDHMLGSVRAIGAILGNLLFFFLVVNLVRSWKMAHTAVAVWMVATVLVGGYTMYDWYFGATVEVQQIGETEARFSTVMQDPSEWERLGLVKRAVGPTSSAAVYGINLAMTLPFFFYFLRQRLRPGLRVALWGGLLVVVYNIFLANTRAALLLLVAIIAISAARRLIVVKPERLFAVAALAVLLVAVAPEALLGRVFDPNRYRLSEAGTMQIRMQFWKAGTQIAREHWLGGFGIGNQTTIPKYLNVVGPEQTTVHNEFLMTLIEVGIFGWLAFFGFVGLVLWYSFRTAAVVRSHPTAPDAHRFMVACQITMIAVLLYGIQVDVFHFPLKGWWLVAGVSCALYRLTQQQGQSRVTLPPIGGATV